MSLSNLIRRKSEPVGFATATPATFATPEGGKARTVASVATVAVAKSPQGQGKARTVASVATVAVAKSPQGQTAPLPKVGAGDTAPLTASEETAIRAWLVLIEETGPATIAEVIGQCQRDADARDYFTGRAAAELPKPEPFPDDRRTCDPCANLIAQRC